MRSLCYNGEEMTAEAPSAARATRPGGRSARVRAAVHRAVEEVRDGDRFLICSDGLYKELSSADLTERLKTATCVAACDALLETAMARECADNVTAIVVDFHEAKE